MNITRNTKKRYFLNLTPLIDIVFLLIVFFMLTSNFVITGVIELNLAKQGDKEVTNDENITITLKPEDKFILQENEYHIKQLAVKIGDALHINANKNIAIFAEKNVTIQDVVTAMDVIAQMGGKNISLVKE